MSALLTWGLVGFLSGLVVFLAVPILAGPMLGAERRAGLANRYYALAMIALDRAMLVRRAHSGYDLVHSSFDAEKEAEEVTLSGETRHFKDTASLMSRFANRPFGLAWEPVDRIIDPMAAELGEFDEQQGEEFGNEMDVAAAVNDQGEVTGTETLVRGRVNIPQTERVVDPSKWLGLLTGDGSPGDGETGEEFVRKSQLPYATRDVIGTMTIIMAWGAGFVMTWFAFQQGSGSSVDVTSKVALMVDVMGVLA